MRSFSRYVRVITLLLALASLQAFGEDVAPSQSPDNTGSDNLAIEQPKKIVYKSNLPNSIALGPRIGGFFFQDQEIPMNASSTNGIRGNFIFNGPTIPTIGFGSRIGLSKLVRFAPSIDFIFDEYVYRSDIGRAFTTQSMTGSAVGPVATVMGLMISLPFWFDFYLSDRVILSVAPGIAIYPRIALIPIDNSTGIEIISASLNADLAWLYPQTGVSIKYALDSNTAVGFEVEVLYPLSHIGKNDNMGLDGLIISGGFSFDLYL